jgi:hypothetical protein
MTLNPVVWWQRWQHRRADRKAIKETLKFMGKWSAYDAKTKKTVAEPGTVPLHLRPKSVSPFAEKVEELKRLRGDPYAFDKAVRDMMGPANGSTLPTDDEIIATAAKRMKRDD